VTLDKGDSVALFFFRLDGGSHLCHNSCVEERPMNIKIKGKGDSLWGKSGGTYTIKRMEVRFENSVKKERFFSVDVFGDPKAKSDNRIDWFQYTDSGIQEECAKKLKKPFMDFFGISPAKVKRFQLTWSEQGAQPSFGWTFHVFVTVK